MTSERIDKLSKLIYLIDILNHQYTTLTDDQIDNITNTLYKVLIEEGVLTDHTMFGH